MLSCNNESSLPDFIHVCLEIDIYDGFFLCLCNEFHLY